MKNNEQEKPPVLKSWNQLYAFVFLHLVALIILYYLFTIYFN